MPDRQVQSRTCVIPCERTILLIIALALLPLLFGCGKQEYQIRVKATAYVTPLAGTYYFLLRGDKSVPIDAAQFKEFADYVKKALAERQYVEAMDLGSADVVIFFSYGLKFPLGYHEALNAPGPGEGIGRMIPFSLSFGSSGGMPDSGSSYFRQVGIPIPFTSPGNVYRRYLTIEAVNGATYNSEGTRLVLWKINAISIGYSTDLRKIFPLLLTACKPYIGETTKKEIVVNLRED
jgi:hypothetical protein